MALVVRAGTLVTNEANVAQNGVTFEALGMVEDGHRTVYGRALAYPTTPLDVCEVARGLGATVLRIEQPGQLRAARDTLCAALGPVVVDVRIDPEITLPKRDRVSAMAPNGAAQC